MYKKQCTNSSRLHQCRNYEVQKLYAFLYVNVVHKNIRYRVCTITIQVEVIVGKVIE